jgi:hypothetical protein
MEVKRISLELSEGLLNTIDQFKREWGLRSRGAIVERLLQELLTDEGSEDLFGEGFPSEQSRLRLDDTNEAGSFNAPEKRTARKNSDEVKDNGHPSPVDAPSAKSQPARARAGVLVSPANQQTNINGLDASDFNERGALVLVAKGAAGSLVLDFESSSSDADSTVPERSSRSGGIDLPGFVRKQTAQIKRSLAPTSENSSCNQEPLPTVPVELLNQALERAKNHWLELYGTPANEAVLEAAMVWLAKDIWPQCDQSEGRLFTWSLACSVIEAFAPTWPPGGASFEKVMVMAGLLEDPFSTSTLQLRLPTLIRRFVHRFRSRKRGTSFQALEHTMTLHGALKLLQLPTSPGHRLALAEIREAYRDIALKTHPDSGGSEEEMRKVNEAYQLLKELYRNG